MKHFAFGIFLLFFLLSSVSAFGQEVRVGPDGEFSEQTLSLPYAFYNESFGFAVGYVYGVVGRPQKQATLLATVMAGSKGSAMGFLVGRDLQMPRVERLFLDPVVSVGYFKDNDAYINGNPDFPDDVPAATIRTRTISLKATAGITSSGSNSNICYQWDRSRSDHRYVQNQRGAFGSGATGGTSLNPLKSGLSYLELRPFYRSQQIDGDDVDETTKTNGLDFSVFLDNRDFRPTLQKDSVCGERRRGISAGSTARIPGQMSRVSWTSTFRSSWDWLRQGVIALDYWTSFSPTWDEQPDGTVDNRPPSYAGSTLGGLWRLRGYPSQRFNDKAAVYYAAELR